MSAAPIVSQAPQSIRDRESGAALNAEVYALYRAFIHREAGINLGDRKQPLVHARLRGRVDAVAGGDFREYYRLITSGSGDERQIAIDRLTTNETHFFREPAHYRWLGRQILSKPPKGRKLRIWSAASSTGEEAYCMAMVCADRLGDAGNFEVFGTDVNATVVATARQGIYPIEKAKEIPDYYLRRYCLRGVRSMASYFTISESIRSKIQFERGNLLEGHLTTGVFDCVFLRNVMIYFDHETKKRIVSNLARHLAPGSYLITGHSESLHGISEGFRRTQPSIYIRE